MLDFSTLDGARAHGSFEMHCCAACLVVMPLLQNIVFIYPSHAQYATAERITYQTMDHIVPLPVAISCKGMHGAVLLGHGVCCGAAKRTL